MAWTEADSAAYRAIASVAVPRRDEMTATLIDTVPFAADDAIAIVDVGAGEGLLSEALLTRFRRATLSALDGSESMRVAATARLGRFGVRARVAPFDLASLDWWDRMSGAHLVVSALCLHHLNDAKKQYLYKAVADRLVPGGALLVADIVDPQHAAARALAADRWDALARAQAAALGAPDLFAHFERDHWNWFRYPDPDDQPAALLHHLVWLRHAGLASVDCVWLDAGHAVFGGLRPAARSERQLRAGS
jgi:trans-aconitate methyltransferase